MNFVSTVLIEGLGNRLFQLCRALHFAEAWNIPFCFVKTAFHEVRHGDLSVVFKLFPQFPLLEDATPAIEIPEETYDHFRYFPPRERPSERPIFVRGFGQHWCYIPPSLRPDFEHALGEDAARIRRESALDTDEQRKQTWFLHFRYGDYLNLPHHQVPLHAYYIQCLQEIPTGARLHCFSDSPEKAASMLSQICERTDLRITWSKETVDIHALYEMSLCHGGAIIANSTFSWWGAYFARCRSRDSYPIFVPDQWFAERSTPDGIRAPWCTVVSC